MKKTEREDTDKLLEVWENMIERFKKVIESDDENVLFSQHDPTWEENIALCNIKESRVLHEHEISFIIDQAEYYRREANKYSCLSKSGATDGLFKELKVGERIEERLSIAKIYDLPGKRQAPKLFDKEYEIVEKYKKAINRVESDIYTEIRKRFPKDRDWNLVRQGQKRLRDKKEPPRHESERIEEGFLTILDDHDFIFNGKIAISQELMRIKEGKLGGERYSSIADYAIKSGRITYHPDNFPMWMKPFSFLMNERNVIKTYRDHDDQVDERGPNGECINRILQKRAWNMAAILSSGVFWDITNHEDFKKRVKDVKDESKYMPLAPDYVNPIHLNGFKFVGFAPGFWSKDNKDLFREELVDFYNKRIEEEEEGEEYALTLVAMSEYNTSFLYFFNMRVKNYHISIEEIDSVNLDDVREVDRGGRAYFSFDLNTNKTIYKEVHDDYTEITPSLRDVIYRPGNHLLSGVSLYFGGREIEYEEGPDGKKDVENPRGIQCSFGGHPESNRFILSISPRIPATQRSIFNQYRASMPFGQASKKAELVMEGSSSSVHGNNIFPANDLWGRAFYDTNFSRELRFTPNHYIMQETGECIVPPKGYGIAHDMWRLLGREVNIDHSHGNREFFIIARDVLTGPCSVSFMIETLLTTLIAQKNAGKLEKEYEWMLEEDYLKDLFEVTSRISVTDERAITRINKVAKGVDGDKFNSKRVKKQPTAKVVRKFYENNSFFKFMEKKMSWNVCDGGIEAGYSQWFLTKLIYASRYAIDFVPVCFGEVSPRFDILVEVDRGNLPPEAYAEEKVRSERDLDNFWERSSIKKRVEEIDKALEEDVGVALHPEILKAAWKVAVHDTHELVNANLTIEGKKLVRGVIPGVK